MNKITTKVSVEKLLVTLKTNRDKHALLFKEVLEGYKKECIKKLSTRLEKANAGELVSLGFGLGTSMPTNNLKQYDLLIYQLEYGEDLEVTLSSSEFDSYINDNWNWKRNTLENWVGYSNSPLMVEECSNYPNIQPAA